MAIKAIKIAAHQQDRHRQYKTLLSSSKYLARILPKVHREHPWHQSNNISSNCGVVRWRQCRSCKWVADKAKVIRRSCCWRVARWAMRSKRSLRMKCLRRIVVAKRIGSLACLLCFSKDSSQLQGQDSPSQTIWYQFWQRINQKSRTCLQKCNK